MISITITTCCLDAGQAATCALCGTPFRPSDRVDMCEGHTFCPYAACAVEYASQDPATRDNIALFAKRDQS